MQVAVAAVEIVVRQIKVAELLLLAVAALVALFRP